MRLYHTGDREIPCPALRRGRRNADFERSFSCLQAGRNGRRRRLQRQGSKMRKDGIHDPVLPYFPNRKADPAQFLGQSPSVWKKSVDTAQRPGCSAVGALKTQATRNL